MAARAATISILAHRPVIVRALSVVVGVTAGAVGLIGRRGPANRLGIALVAGCTPEIGAMVTWIVWRTVSEDKRCPVICAVAGIALQARDKMTA